MTLHKLLDIMDFRVNSENADIANVSKNYLTNEKQNLVLYSL